jgi:hypothetical protein
MLPRARCIECAFTGHQGRFYEKRVYFFGDCGSHDGLLREVGAHDGTITGTPAVRNHRYDASWQRYHRDDPGCSRGNDGVYALRRWLRQFETSGERP